jgi:catalase
MADDALGERLVEAVQAVTGVHPGRRVLHAKGVGARGRFRSSGLAAGLTVAAHLQPGVETPVDARFSNGSADPAAPDGARDGRGFATKFHLAAGAAAAGAIAAGATAAGTSGTGTTTDIVALSLPVFFVRTPDDFVAFVAVRQPDPATGEMDLDKVLAFLGEHPEAQLAAQLSVAAPAPVSYSRVTYHSVHVFWLVDGDGVRRPVRYRWEPVAGEAGLTDEQAAAAPGDYLADALADDLGRGPVTFDLHLVLGAPEDPVGDPTAPWPDDRPTVVAGTLELTELADVEALIFDPTRVTAGIECSDDPILAARSAAYGASYARRTG